jgi:isopentenyldiphosphate isomerase
MNVDDEKIKIFSHAKVHTPNFFSHRFYSIKIFNRSELVLSIKFTFFIFFLSDRNRAA